MTNNSNAQLDLFRDNLPYKARCTNDPSQGTVIRNIEHALKRSHIQYNPPPAIVWMVFDLDYDGAATSWMDEELPPPAWVSINPDNGHAHVAYGISTPVCRTEFAHSKPLYFLKIIEQAYRKRLKGDAEFSCFLTKNPLHDRWRTYYPPSINGGIYDLSYLAEFVELKKPDKRKKRQNREEDSYGVGRNCSLFDNLAVWAYVAVREYWYPGGEVDWFEACRLQADKYNDFLEPLPTSEVRASYRSVAKWVWRNFSPGALRELIERTHTPEMQAERGKQSGVVRAAKAASLAEQAKLLREQGLKQKDIAEELGVGVSTVRRYLKTAHKPISDTKKDD